MCTSIDKLWFSDFIDCACDGNLSALVISGTATEEQLVEAWIELMTQYQERMKSAGSDDYNTLTAKINRLEGKIHTVEGLIAAVKLVYNTHYDITALSLDASDMLTCIGDLADSLREWEYDGDFTLETLEKDLKAVEISLANDKTQLAIARVEYDEKQEGKETEEVSADDKRRRYLDALTEMGVHFKTGALYMPEQTTTGQFVYMYNRIQAFYKAQKVETHASE